MITTVGRLKSNGVMQVYDIIDELSYPDKNVGITTDRIFYASLFDENVSSNMQSNTPLKITGDKKVLAYNYFDERTLSFSNDIFASLVSLSYSLNIIASVTNTDFKNVQSTIQSSNPSFNVFAVATKNNNSEELQGISSSNGKYAFTSPGFVYNSSNSDFLSTGKEIIDMNTGINYGLPEIDGKKWMAAAIYDGTTNGFRGILLWVFTNNTIDNLNNVVIDGKKVTSTRTIFYPTLNPLEYMSVYQVVIGKEGNIIEFDTTGNGGWGYSNNQNPTVTGYHLATNFSFDDGLWAFILGEKTDGNDGPTYKTTNGYGFGNYNQTDSSSSLYWQGSNVATSNYVGFIFTGDSQI